MEMKLKWIYLNSLKNQEANENENQKHPGLSTSQQSKKSRKEQECSPTSLSSFMTTLETASSYLSSKKSQIQIS